MFSSTRLSQMLQAFPRQYFNAAVKECGADRYAKKVTFWDLLTSLMFGHLTQTKSLRKLAKSSEALKPHRYHLNAGNISRSTLSDALNKRDPKPVRLVAKLMLHAVGRKQRKTF